MAEGIELAKAYVQIVPTTKGIQGKLDSALSSAGEKAGEKGGSGIAGGIGKAVGGIAKVAAAGVAAVTSGMTAFGVSSVNAGKEFDAAMSQVAATMGLTTADIEPKTPGGQPLIAAVGIVFSIALGIYTIKRMSHRK